MPWRECSTDSHLSHAEGGEDATGLEPETTRLNNKRLDGRRIDGLSTAEREGELREVEILHALQSTGGEHPREVWTRRGSATVIADPLHPVTRVGHEILRCRLNKLASVGHRNREKSDQSHVVIERQPRHHDLVGTKLRRSARSIDIRGEYPIGDHHAFGFAGRAAGVLQDHQALWIVGRNLKALARRIARTGHDCCHWLDRWVARTRLVKRRQRIVDENKLCVAVLNATASALDKCIERCHPHRERQHHAGDAAEPTPLDDGHERAAGGSEDCYMVAGHEPAGLQCCTNCAGFVVDLTPRNKARLVGGGDRSTYKADPRWTVGRSL